MRVWRITYIRPPAWSEIQNVDLRRGQQGADGRLAAGWRLVPAAARSSVVRPRLCGCRRAANGPLWRRQQPATDGSGLPVVLGGQREGNEMHRVGCWRPPAGVEALSMGS